MILAGSDKNSSMPFSIPPEIALTKNVWMIMNPASFVNVEASTTAPDTGPSYMLNARSI